MVACAIIGIITSLPAAAAVAFCAWARHERRR
jgi:hypothetical protein